MGENMKLHVSRQEDGHYILTRLKPRLIHILGTDFSDWFEEDGEPIGVRHLSPRLVNLNL